MKRFLTQYTVFLVAVCLAAAAFPGKDLVLCIGSHGHIAFEYAQNGRCYEGPCEPVGKAPQAPGAARDDNVGSDCLSCVDIPVSQGPVVSPTSASSVAKRKSGSPVGPDMSAVLPAHPAPVVFGAAFCASLSPPGTCPPSGPLSRVLRI